MTKDAVTKNGQDKPRVLIVEDDSAIAAGLRLNLRHEGYVVTVEADGELGLKRALQDVPDLVILDVMLPTMNGFEVLRELRRRGNTAGIIMLTAKGLEEDKVLGLDLGADDYVQKPFGLSELIARVNAVLRRRAALKPSVVLFDDVAVDRRARAVTRAGEVVALSPREMALLLFFVDHPGAPTPVINCWRGRGGSTMRAPNARSTTSSCPCEKSWSTTQTSQPTLSPSGAPGIALTL